jgi:NAD(P)-dependent dehydrogenase (short-subunit alcohol dehydrogenase family)
MRKLFENKVVFLTGASTGIGRAAAKLFAAEGARLIICARGVQALENTADEIRAAGGAVKTLALDVGDLDAYRNALEQTAREYGRLDVLINNAMYGNWGGIADMSLEEWRQTFLVNSDAIFVSVRAALKLMATQGAGSIVNVSSLSAIRAAPGLAAYSAAKAALIQFSACAAMEGAYSNIRVNTVIPGVIDTDSMRQSFGNNADIEKTVTASIPLHRFGRPDEVAQAILFLASDNASYITGTCLSVDGGKSSQLYSGT